MPFTPYHFGPSGFIGLVFRKWIDLPVFVLVNIIVDVEVLIIQKYQLGWPIHRYAHTFLIGAAVGAVWGIAAYPFRPVFRKLMKLLRLQYESGLRKMVVSGVLGVWLHVLIDGFYHHDIRIFWPNKAISIYQIVHPYVSKGHIRIICLLFFIPAIILYLLTIIKSAKDSQKEKKHEES